MRSTLTHLFALLLSLTAIDTAEGPAKRESIKPNFIIIYPDDQGHGNLGCSGSTTIRRPNSDQLAKEIPD